MVTPQELYGSLIMLFVFFGICCLFLIICGIIFGVQKIIEIKNKKNSIYLVKEVDSELHTEKIVNEKAQENQEN